MFAPQQTMIHRYPIATVPATAGPLACVRQEPLIYEPTPPMLKTFFMLMMRRHSSSFMSSLKFSFSTSIDSRVICGHRRTSKDEAKPERRHESAARHTLL